VSALARAACLTALGLTAISALLTAAILVPLLTVSVVPSAIIIPLLAVSVIPSAVIISILAAAILIPRLAVIAPAIIISIIVATIIISTVIISTPLILTAAIIVITAMVVIAAAIILVAVAIVTTAIVLAAGVTVLLLARFLTVQIVRILKHTDALTALALRHFTLDARAAPTRHAIAVVSVFPHFSFLSKKSIPFGGIFFISLHILSAELFFVLYFHYIV
jgi:hypothetical protein